MNVLKRILGGMDRFQRAHAGVGVPYAVVKKFGDDTANLYVVALAWYGFTAIFPLLLAVVTILGFVGQKSLGSTVVDTLHKFPVVGDSFNPGNGSQLHGSTVGLIVGLLGLLYGAQGVTQTAQQAMASVWNIPQLARTGFLPRLGRSFAGLATIGGSFLLNALITTYITRSGESYAIRIPVLIGLLALNCALYWLSWFILTPKTVSARRLVPGAVVGGIAFTLLITVGTGLVQHQLKNTSNTYGTFGSVIGIVAFLLLLSKISLYAAELNPVLDRRLYPRALPMGDPTEADKRVDYDLIKEQRRRPDESIGVGIGPDSQQEAAEDALDRDASEAAQQR